MDNNYFLDKEKIKTIDTYRIVYFILFLVAFGLTEIGRYIYRPFIYENRIDDYGIADSMGNSGGIIVQIFFGLAIINSTFKKGLRLILFFIFGYILYETAQTFLPKGVFDWKDIYGTIIGGVVALILYIIVRRLINKNKVYYRF